MSATQQGEIMIDSEVSRLMMELFNRMTTKQKKSVSSEDSSKVGDFMASNGYRFVFDRWYLQAKPDERKNTFIIGQVERALKNTRIMRIYLNDTVFEIPVVNCSAFEAEIGRGLCEEYPDAPFSALYCDHKDVRTWTLRSTGVFDVSKIAAGFGGGGHKNAAAFSTAIGWPQYDNDEFVKAFAEKTK